MLLTSAFRFEFPISGEYTIGRTAVQTYSCIIYSNIDVCNKIYFLKVQICVPITAKCQPTTKT